MFSTSLLEVQSFSIFCWSRFCSLASLWKPEKLFRKNEIFNLTHSHDSTRLGSTCVGVWVFQILLLFLNIPKSRALPTYPFQFQVHCVNRCHCCANYLLRSLVEVYKFYSRMKTIILGCAVDKAENKKELSNDSSPFISFACDAVTHSQCSIIWNSAGIGKNFIFTTNFE